MPLIARPVLRLAADAFDQLQVGVLFGSFTAVLVLFTVPITLLGTISPFAIRLAISDPQQAGPVSGPHLCHLHPRLVHRHISAGAGVDPADRHHLHLPGVQRCSCCWWRWAACGWPAGWRSAAAPGLDAAGPAVAGRSVSAEAPDQDSRRADLRDRIGLQLHPGARAGRLPLPAPERGPGRAFDLASHPTGLSTAPGSSSWRRRSSTRPLTSRQTCKQHGHRRPGRRHRRPPGHRRSLARSRSTATRSTPRSSRSGREYFDMNHAQPERHRRRMGAGGWSAATQRYTIIGVDAYRPPYIPWHLTTQEFFQIVYDHLDEDGVLVINVGRSPDDRRLIDGLVGTIQTRLPLASTSWICPTPSTRSSTPPVSRPPSRTCIDNLVHLYTLQDEIDPLLHAGAGAGRDATSSPPPTARWFSPTTGRRSSGSPTAWC